MIGYYGCYLFTRDHQVFGVLPPQNLYHTRHMPSPLRTPPWLHSTTLALDAVRLPVGTAPTEVTASDNFDQTAYKRYAKKTQHRSGTPESGQRLLPMGGDNESNNHSEQRDDVSDKRLSSVVYTHYQHSLNSLLDIIDKVCPILWISVARW
jgi:hypothetical protein